MDELERLRLRRDERREKLLAEVQPHLGEFYGRVISGMAEERLIEYSSEGQTVQESDTPL